MLIAERRLEVFNFCQKINLINIKGKMPKYVGKGYGIN